MRSGQLFRKEFTMSGSVLPITAAAGVFGCVLLVAVFHAQATAATKAETSVSALPVPGAAAEHHGVSVRPFRINVPEAALVDPRRLSRAGLR
jgi:hypothetical protein